MSVAERIAGGRRRGCITFVGLQDFKERFAVGLLPFEFLLAALLFELGLCAAPLVVALRGIVNGAAGHEAARHVCNGLGIGALSRICKAPPTRAMPRWEVEGHGKLSANSADRLPGGEGRRGVSRSQQPRQAARGSVGGRAAGGIGSDWRELASVRFSRWLLTV